MNGAGFYKLDGTELLYSPNAVQLPNGESLLPENSGDYSYPVDGWYWFTIESDAQSVLIDTINGVPRAISAFQAYAILSKAGYLPAIQAAMQSPGVDPIVKLAFEKAVEFRRESQSVNAIAESLGITQQQLDYLFIEGAKINV